MGEISLKSKNTYSLGDSNIAANRLKLINDMFNLSTRRFLRENASINPKVAIDLGCGPGLTTKSIKEELKPFKLIGIDISDFYVNKANQESDIAFIKWDTTEMPLPYAPANLIYARFLLAHLPNIEEAITKWHGCLAEDGLLMIEDTEWISSEEKVFKEYHALVEETIKNSGGKLYIGNGISEIASYNDRKVITNQIVEVQPPIELAAKAFKLNLEVLKNTEFVKKNYDQKYIADLLKSIQDVAENPMNYDKNLGSKWGIRQIMIKKESL
ncbi:class I SAM-dependent methyltransferase [Bacillus cereus]|uniref:class I SAM-dependent methyltransferase n=1 Tax=Bacillus cereus TaxID=1396 RepID=UPI002EDB024D